LGESAGVGAVEVVGVGVALEVTFERRQLGQERAGEGGAPAFLEDRQLQPLDVSVGGRAAGADPALLDRERCERLGEGGGAEFGAVVCDDRVQAPAGGSQFGSDAFDERRAVAGCGIARRGLELGPGETGADLDRRVLPPAPFVPERRPTKKQSSPTSSPGSDASTCRSGSDGCGPRSERAA